MSETLRERAEALLAVVAEHEVIVVIVGYVDEGVWRDESEDGRRLADSAPNTLAGMALRYIAAAREELKEALDMLDWDGKAGPEDGKAEAIVSRWEKALGVQS